MNDFNYKSLTKNGPLIIDTQSSMIDPQVAKVAKHLSNKKLNYHGHINHLLLSRNNMTDAGIRYAHDGFLDKLKSILPSANEEVNELTKLIQTSGYTVLDQSIPDDYIHVSSFFGSSNQSIPTYIGLSMVTKFKLDNKLLMKQQQFTEKDVINHFDDVKAYWNLIESGAASSALIELVKKINNDEDSFFVKARDFNASMAGKLFNRPYNTVSLALTSKGAKNVKYYTDPWIGFCTKMQNMRIKNGDPNFMITYNLASFDDIKEIQNHIGTYYLEITLYYSVTKPFLGSFKFERNGKVF